MSKVFIQNESGNILAKDDEPYMIDQVGTDVFVNGVIQDRLDFASDPQEQITANKLSDAQMQAIGEIDAIKGIALQNQSDVTELSASVLANTNKLNDFNIKGLKTLLFRGNEEDVITPSLASNSFKWFALFGFNNCRFGFKYVDVNDPSKVIEFAEASNSSVLISFNTDAIAITLFSPTKTETKSLASVSKNYKITVNTQSYGHGLLLLNN